MPGDIISHLCNHKWWSYDVWFLEYGAWQTEFFVILGHFFSLYPTNNLKNQNFEKMIKKPEDTIILPLCTTNDNHMMYGSWDIKCDRIFFLILDYILPFYSSNNQENLNFEKMKNMPGDITLHMCTINENLMMYGSWDMEHDRHNFLSFCNIFCTLTLPPSTPPSNSRNQSSENMKKKLGDIITLHMCTINDNHMMYGSWDMECNRQNLFSFWIVFCSFTPLTTRKIKILKNGRNAWRYHYFTLVYHKWQSYDVRFLRYGVWHTEFFLILDYILPFYSPTT